MQDYQKSVDVVEQDASLICVVALLNELKHIKDNYDWIRKKSIVERRCSSIRGTINIQRTIATNALSGGKYICRCVEYVIDSRFYLEISVVLDKVFESVIETYDEEIVGKFIKCSRDTYNDIIEHSPFAMYKVKDYHDFDYLNCIVNRYLNIYIQNGRLLKILKLLLDFIHCKDKNTEFDLIFNSDFMSSILNDKDTIMLVHKWLRNN